MATVSMEMRETEAKIADLQELENSEPGESENGGAAVRERPGPPTNPMVSALLTDMYQITMAYAYWKAGKHEDRAV